MVIRLLRLLLVVDTHLSRILLFLSYTIYNNDKQINIVDTLNDAMYSDSRLVVDALAEFMESVMERHQVVAVSDRRMNQVRYIMQVEIDEEFFRSNITAEQLVTIESKEMAVILEELVSSVGLQRFRFVDRQAKGTL